MRPLLLPPSLLVALLLQTAPAHGIDNDFSAYPEGSQQCLYDAADSSQCTGSTGQELNQCLCTNQGNFIYNTADCVAKASPADLEAVYSTLENNCAGTGVTIAVSKEAFLSSAAAATSSTSSTSTAISTSTTSSSDGTTATTSYSTSTTSTSSTSSSPTNTGTATPDDTGSLTTGAKIGVGVGVAFGAIVAALAAWFIWAYSRRKRNYTHHSQLQDLNLNSDDSNPSNTNGLGFAPSSNPYNTEFAQHNPQHEAAELAPVEWKPGGYYSPTKDGAGEQGAKASEPLLAELGGDDHHGRDVVEMGESAPVELPADEAYLGYTDHSPNPNSSPSHGAAAGDRTTRSVSMMSSQLDGGLSPAGYSQGAPAAGDVSPFSSRHSGTTGTGTGVGTGTY
ncbi:Uu.00g057700.m01.CDS01 [Anthostomella pinea]|uniref:Uu.00g057700.m01.CDS01 n=1 Tax=Anthostomella pinea TaxID=933095 RepID=A0AAI8VRS1_9PEZI|nr:Uu.00g057700.m01.CDS01 [Anthostomella pinea]